MESLIRIIFKKKVDKIVNQTRHGFMVMNINFLQIITPDNMQDMQDYKIIAEKDRSKIVILKNEHNNTWIINK